MPTKTVLLTAYDSEQPSVVFPGAVRCTRVVRVLHGETLYTAQRTELKICGVVDCRTLEVSSRLAGRPLSRIEWHEISDLPAAVATEIGGAL